jgi:predicted NAD/FAD-binding protein
MIRFCHNHGLLQITNRPQWRTVTAGARNYVNRILAKLQDTRLNSPVEKIERHLHGTTLYSKHGAERFDHVILATHPDQALAILDAPSVHEREILSAIRYQSNRAVLHMDTRMMPQNPKAWAAWNYERSSNLNQENTSVCLHYWLNRLQPLPTQHTVIESLNPVRDINPKLILDEFHYSHPIFDLKAIQAQQRLPTIQGLQHTWFCGAWGGYGFHEDGFKSGQAAANALLEHTQTQRKAAA